MSKIDDLLKFSGKKPRIERVARFKGGRRCSPVVCQSVDAKQNVVVKAAYAHKSRMERHVNYLTRGGVGLDGQNPELFTKENEQVQENLEPIEGEKHFFKFIISPENGEKIESLQEYTQDVMAKAEQITGQKLIWVATDHHNTDHPHVHVVVRGVSDGKELFLDKEFPSKTFREICKDRATQELGYRSEREMKQQRENEISAERFTSIDRQILTLANDNVVKPDKDNQLRRLKYLESLNLAERISKNKYQLTPGWDRELKNIALNRDILKTMYADLKHDRSPQIYSREMAAYIVVNDKISVQGKLIKKGVANELYDKQYAIIHNQNTGNYYYIASYAVSKLKLGQETTIENGKIVLKQQEKKIDKGLEREMKPGGLTK